LLFFLVSRNLGDFERNWFKSRYNNPCLFLHRLKLITTAPTILAGIKKDGQDISIVARPAYEGEVIIYYGSERDILDYEPSELWIDDGVDPRKISLGHILKKAQIIKFPI
jgi:hypothetical protein